MMLLRYPDRLFIGGVWTEPSGNDHFTVISPHNEMPFAKVARALEPDIDRAVAAARDAFDNGPWPRMTAAERAAYLRAIAAALPGYREKFADAWVNETGVLAGIAQYSAPQAVELFTSYAEIAGSFDFEIAQTPSTGRGAGVLVREPVGVVGAIVPWNAPLSLLSLKVAPALLAGCTIILKASPEAPFDAYLFAEICEAVGLPAGVLNVVTADREVSERLVRHPDVDKISFTGSSVAGKRIASLCGERIARYTLELGGKSAAIILDDFDIGQAAATLARSLAMLSGQVCAALTRVIVPRHRHDDLVEATASALGALIVGDPYDPASHLGPLAVRRQLERVQAYIAAGTRDGARLVCGGGRPSGLDRGWFIEPTLFANVDNSLAIAQEEIFGPVLSVIPVADEEDAIRVANDTIYGLNNAVFTNDVDAAYRVARRLRSGTVGQNGFRTDFSIAFGGFKQSGIGREGGREGLLPYLETKTLLLDERPSHLN